MMLSQNSKKSKDNEAVIEALHLSADVVKRRMEDDLAQKAAKFDDFNYKSHMSVSKIEGTLKSHVRKRGASGEAITAASRVRRQEDSSGRQVQATAESQARGEQDPAKEAGA